MLYPLSRIWYGRLMSQTAPNIDSNAIQRARGAWLRDQLLTERWSLRKLEAATEIPGLSEFPPTTLALPTAA